MIYIEFIIPGEAGGGGEKYILTAILTIGKRYEI